MSGACFFGEGNQLLKFAQETAFQPQCLGSGTRRRRDRGGSHHGELAAPRPWTPDPGMGQEAPEQGTYLGHAAQARGWRRWTREYALLERRFPAVCCKPGLGGEEGLRRAGKTLKWLSAPGKFWWQCGCGWQLSEARA